jgi:predicted ATPase/DNA-binding SARP family transcriptional activator
VHVALLGPVRVSTDGGEPVRVGGVRLRMLIARLALDAGSAVSAAELIDGLWGEQPPADAGNALQALVSRLRRAVGAAAVRSAGRGYLLAVRDEDVDAHRFEVLAGRGRRALAAGRAQAALELLEAAAELWRGPALADVLDAPFATAPAARLEELRIAAVEDAVEARLQLGRHAEAVVELEAVAGQHPLRERLVTLRMRALHSAGRRSDALAVYELARRSLADQLGVDPSPQLQAAHVAVLRGDAGRSHRTPGRLPAPLTSFVGRDGELARLAGLLGPARVVTLVGPGGAGKTRLAVEAVRRHPAHAAGRAWFVALSGVSTTEAVPDAALAAVAPRPAGQLAGPRPVGPLDQLVDRLDVGAAVLVLDNCEHVLVAAAELVHELLERLPALLVLATSREPLRLTEEALCPVGPLGLPAATADTAAAREAPAVRLFLERAAAVRPDFPHDAATLGVVAGVCRRLDGLPLAVELAAARLRSMDVEQIARRLDDRFRLLDAGSPTADRRQRTLLAVVAWSWELLTGREQAAARRLSVFPGGATLAAAEVVCAAPPLPADEVVYALTALVEKSVVEHGGGPDPRYRMSETVRAFAAAELRTAGEEAVVVARMAAFLRGLAAEHEPRLRSGAQLASLAVFDAEHDNLLAVLRGALERADAGTAAELVFPLYAYWTLQGRPERAQPFLAELRRMGDALAADTRAAVRALWLLGEQGGPSADPSAVAAAVEDCVRTGATGRYPALVLVLPVLHFLGQDELAGREVARAQQHPDGWVRGGGHWLAAFLRTERGDWRGGAELRVATLRELERVGDRLGLAMALSGVARDHSVRGEHAAAIAAHVRSVELAAELGTDDEIWYRTRLATERARAGDPLGARDEVRAAHRRVRETGRRHPEVEVLACTADLHRRAGDPAAAERVLAELTALAAELALPAEQIEHRVAPLQMAVLLAGGAPAARARGLLARVLAAALAVRDPAPVAELLARLLLAEGDPAAAATALGMSEAVRGAFDDGEPELRSLVDELVDQLGEPAHAEAFRRGAALSREDALSRLAEQCRQPDR